MQIIIKTYCGGKEEKTAIESVISVEDVRTGSLITYKDDSGELKTQEVTLNGNTELIVR